MIRRRFTSWKPNRGLAVLRLGVFCLLAGTVRAQEAPPIPTNASAVSLTLNRAIELALQNSSDIQVATLQASLADRSPMITRAQRLPNLYAGSAASYTPGILEPRG